jgi:hypothetical protein
MLRKEAPMIPTRSTWRTVVALGIVTLFLAPVTVLAEKDEDLWDQKFKGHEMWLNDLDEALALSVSEDKPILIDIYSRK